MKTLLITGMLLIPMSALGLMWDFETDGDTQGWTRGGGIWSQVGGTYEDMSVSGGVLYLDLLGQSGVLLVSPQLDADAALFDKLTIRIRMRDVSVIGAFEMDWLASDLSSAQGKGIQGWMRFPHAWTEDWQEINMSKFTEDGAWRGELVRIWLNFILRDKSVGEQEVPDQVEIDWIALTGELEELLDEEIQPAEEPFTPGHLFGHAVHDRGVIAPYSGGRVWGEDWDGDGDMDLMIRGSVGLSGKLFTVLNEGQGVFLKSWEHAFEEDHPLILAGRGDVDGDGDVDLVVSRFDEAMISVFLNRGNGTFSQGGRYPVGPYPGRGWVGDLDGDGDADMVVANTYFNLQEYPEPQEGSLSVLLNAGDGTFPSSEVYAAGAHPANVWGGDLDGDGDQDIVVVSEGWFGDAEDLWDSPPDYVYVWLNDGMGGLYDRQGYQVGNHPYELWGGDVDGDGDLDLVVMNHCDEQTLVVLLNRGDAVFEDGGRYEQIVKQPLGVCGSDFDLDGDIDLAVSGRWSELVVLLNRGDGRFEQEGGYRTPMQQSGPFGADIDGDGDVDLVIGGEGGFFVLPNRCDEEVTSVALQQASAGAREQRWTLHPGYPNPFNEGVAMLFEVACSGRVELGVYNLVGQRVRTLREGYVERGAWEVRWDGRDQEGRGLSSGTYIVTREGEGVEAVQRVLLMR